MEKKFVIVNLKSFDVMKDLQGNVKLYNSLDDALLDCGLYEFEDVWITQLIYNYKEDDKTF